MPTTQYVTYTYGVWDGGTAVAGGWKLSSRGTASTLSRFRDYPVTLARVKPKPADLFMASTSRTTKSQLQNSAIMDWSTNDAFGTKYTNYPFWSMFTSTSSRYLSPVWNDLVQINPPKTSLDRNSMYNTIRKKLRGDATNLANMLGEYRETADTFLQFAKIVSTRGRSLLRHHNPSKSGRTGVDVSSTLAHGRLAWNYGVAPLANDMGTAIAELRSSISAIPPFVQGVESRKDRVTNVGYKQSSSNFKIRARSELAVETRYRTKWRAYMNQNALLACLAEHGMLNPLGVAWELMPYSFVFDWWFNVGDILSSLDNLLLVDSLWAIDSSSIKTSEWLTFDQKASNLYVWQTAFRNDRTDSRLAPVSISRVSVLQYKPSLSLGHFLNGLALLQVASKRL